MENFDKVQRNRHANLVALVHQCGDQVEFARRIERKKEQVNPLFLGKKPIGRPLSRHIESAFGKPKFWMDEDHLDTGDAELDKLVERAKKDPRVDLKAMLLALYRGDDEKNT